jgi:hypothetical protein
MKLTYIVNLHLPQRARPAVESKDLIREGYRLIALKIRDLAASVTRSRRYVFRAELLVEPALQRRNLCSCEAVHDAFFVWVRDVAAVVLIAWPVLLLATIMLSIELD